MSVLLNLPEKKPMRGWPEIKTELMEMLRFVCDIYTNCISSRAACAHTGLEDPKILEITDNEINLAFMIWLILAPPLGSLLTNLLWPR